MTREEAKKINSLNIKVTEAVEDAFYALREVESGELDKRLAELPKDYISGDEGTDRLLEKYLHDLRMSEEAKKRLEAYPKEVRHEAVLAALKMLENIEEYGVACAEWT